MKRPCVYILANRRNGALYIGVTADLTRRIGQHREGTASAFTRRYGIRRLVHAEFHDTMLDAINREKRLKEWQRVWKLELIESTNPEWRDLYDDLVGL